MSLGLSASADGLSIDLKLGTTVLATFSTNGVEAGTLLADAATAQGLANVKKLLTPAGLANAFGGANQLMNTNGYQKLPGGLIVQWGYGAATANMATGGAVILATIALPITFPNARLFSLTNGNVQSGDVGGDTNEVMVYVQSCSTSQIIVTGTRVAGSYSAGQMVGYSWIAIGY